jgi:hypothetical protein
MRLDLRRTRVLILAAGATSSPNSDNSREFDQERTEMQGLGDIQDAVRPTATSG